MVALTTRATSSRLRHVAGNRQRAPSGGFDFADHLIELRFIARRQRNRRAFRRKSQRDAFADSPARAGYDRDLSRQQSTHFVGTFREE